uniref:CCHC-type domain-containing protein n=1 Tax=Pygocentrus nattereri TaxID=42514 RepID=A0AAR2L8I6_PYGNA
MPLTRDYLQNWCKGEELGVHQAMLVVGVGEDDDVSRIEEVLHTVRCWGRVRVRGRTFDVETNSLVALCECKEALNSPNVPPEVRPPDGSLPWKIVTANPAPATSDEFAEKLKNFMLAEGKTVKDLQFFCQPPSPKDGTVESLIHAMGEFMNQSQRAPPENHSYRRLRTFSGVIPTPLGEEPFEHWMEQATLLIEESDCSGKEKKRRIIESLKGPALEIVRALRFTDPEAKPGEYLDALNCAFGSAESGEDLYFSFRLIQQKSGEKLSDFARRLEPFLARVVQKGGIMAKDMDRVRVEQLLRGAVGADLMLLQLRLKERRGRPPKFLDLLSEIRAEEEYERSQSDNVSLKEQMAGLAEQPKSRAEDAQALLLPVLHSDDKGYSEAVALQKNVNRVKRKLQHLPVRDTTARVAMTKPLTAAEAKQVSSREDDYFCYRCGENGHIATKCTLPENEKKVIQKLIASLRKTKDNRKSVSSDQARK